MNEQEKSHLAAALEGLNKELRARRRARFWKRFLMLALLALLLLQLAQRHPAYHLSQAPRAVVIDVFGLIDADAPANAADITALLREAAQDDRVRHIVLNIDSGGGSPVQSAQIYRAIRQLPEHIAVSAVIADTGASGAYYIAAAADTIYADYSSIVGSIGVIGSQFGIRDLLDKIGVQPRTFTAGEHKNFLSSTEALKPEEVAHMQALLDDMHGQFISDVKAGRGKRLADEPQLFSGLFWTGRQAKELGLVDELHSLDEVLNDKLAGHEVVYLAPQLPFLQRLQYGFSRSLLQLQKESGGWRWR